MDLSDIKKQARRAAAKCRAEAHGQLQGIAAAALAERGLPAWLRPGVVSGFMPYKSEISTLPLLNRLRREGWVTALPVVLGEGLPLQFRAWAPGDALVPGVWDIPIPEIDDEVFPDVLLVPGLLYDRAGYRLGYGGGFYDRTLAKLRAIKRVTAIGVGYHAQTVDAVPRADYDQPLDFIMTERETIACG